MRSWMMYTSIIGLGPQKLMILSSCKFINTSLSVILNGFSGSGKCYLACYIEREACLYSLRTQYIRIPNLMILNDEATLIKQGVFKLLKKFARNKFLILMSGSWTIWPKKNYTPCLSSSSKDKIVFQLFSALCLGKRNGTPG